jgi:hypothetical protein
MIRQREPDMALVIERKAKYAGFLDMPIEAVRKALHEFIPGSGWPHLSLETIVALRLIEQERPRPRNGIERLLNSCIRECEDATYDDGIPIRLGGCGGECWWTMPYASGRHFSSPHEALADFKDHCRLWLKMTLSETPEEYEARKQEVRELESLLREES